MHTVLESPLAFAFNGANVGQKRFYTRVGHGRHHSPHEKIYPVAPQLTAPGRLPVSKRVGTGTACQSPRGLQWANADEPNFFKCAHIEFDSGDSFDTTAVGAQPRSFIFLRWGAAKCVA